MTITMNKNKNDFAIKKRGLRGPLLAAAVALLLLGGYGVLAYSSGFWPFQNLTSNTDNSISYEPASDEEIEAGEETSEQKDPSKLDPATTPHANPEAEDKGNNEPGPRTGTAGTVSITVSTQEGQTLRIRTLIVSPDPSGACRLTLTRGNEIAYSERVATQRVANNATCQGFDVDTTDLAKGPYQASVTYANASGSTDVRESITIK